MKMLHLLFQSGMQAVHYAAASGHLEVLNLLIDRFGIDPQEKETEVSVRMSIGYY